MLKLKKSLQLNIVICLAEFTWVNKINLLNFLVWVNWVDNHYYNSTTFSPSVVYDSETSFQLQTYWF